jgi:hypothetical protein
MSSRTRWPTAALVAGALLIVSALARVNGFQCGLPGVATCRSMLSYCLCFYIGQVEPH